MITTEAPSRESLGNFLQKERDDAHFDGSINYEKNGTTFRCSFCGRFSHCIPYRFLDFHVPPHERWWRRAEVEASSA